MLASATAKHVNNQIREYFDGERGEEILHTVVKGYFSGNTGMNLMGELVNKHLESEQGRRMMVEVINNAMRSVADRFSERIDRNTKKLVADVARLDEIESLEKRNPQYLDDFLSRPKIQELKERNVTVALTVPLRKGKKYHPWMLKEYLLKLKKQFGSQFRFVLVLDRDGSFVAELDPDELEKKTVEVYELFNKPAGRLSIADAKSQLSQLFGSYCTSSISYELTIQQALMKPIWREPAKLKEDMPVLDSSNKFIGTTNREHLIMSLLD